MSGMTSYFLRRLLLVPVTFLLITFMVYTILRVVPGGPIEQAEARMRLGGMTEGGTGGGDTGDTTLDVPVSELRRLQQYYNLDQPIPVGYLQWLGVWPRDINTAVPPVPRANHSDAFDLLAERTETLATARSALDEALAADEQVLFLDEIWRPVPMDEVPPDMRAGAELRTTRSLPPHYPAQEFLAESGFARDGDRYLTAVDPDAEVAAALAAWRAARDDLRGAQEETGYVLTDEGRLLQTEFAELLDLRAAQNDAAGRLAAHLAERDLIEFGGGYYRPLTEEERTERPDYFEEMDELAHGGYGKQDDLIEDLSDEGMTWQSGDYYVRLDEEAQAEDADFFATADALLAARRAARARLEQVKDEDGYEVTEDLRIEMIDTRISGILQLDFGTSYQFTRPVLSLIGSRIEISLQFGLTGYFLTWLICVPLGVMKAIKHRTNFDTGTSVVVFLGYSIPGFVLSLILLSTLAVNFDWIPLGGYKPPNLDELGWFESVIGRIRYMMIPVAGYLVGGFAVMTILMKNSLLDNLGQDYVRTAFAKGLSEKRVIFVHALRNSLIPITAGIGHALGLLFAGSFLIEKTCNIPGMGLLGYNAILARDYPIILGLLVFLVLIRLTGNIISDIIWALIDPRIRFG